MRPGEHHPGRECVESGTLAELRHLTRTSITADLAVGPRRPGRAARRARRDGGRTPGALEVDTTQLDAVLDALQTGGVRSLLSQPPTLEDLFLRHYGDRIDAAEEGEPRDRNPRLLRAFLRRDRWLYLWWGLGVALLYVSQAWSVDGLYTTQAEFDKAAASMEGNAALVAMAGPARALNTTGGQVTWQAAAFGAICAGLMSMFIVGRHTRAEEESGRDELVRGRAGRTVRADDRRPARTRCRQRRARAARGSAAWRVRPRRRRLGRARASG